ncbi:amidohydrolase family protein, partial [Thermodesulfobacteriota bacterium]
MKGRFLVLLLLLIVTAFAGCATTNIGSNGLLALTNVTVIDVAEGKARPDMTVVISGDRITNTGPTGKTTPPFGARIIDARGKYLIPGLCDMHVHFAAEETNLLLFLANGVTLIRGMGSVVIEPGGLEGFTYVPRQTMIDKILQNRDRVARGELLGPTIITPGFILTGPLPPGAPYKSIDFQWALTEEKEARSAVRSLNDQGVDFIKVHMTPRSVYFAVADEARHLGLPFAGHVPISITAVEAVRTGQASIEHMTGVKEYIDAAEPKGDPAAMDRRKEELFSLFAQSPDTWHVPTMALNQAFALADELYAHPDRESRLKYVRPELMAWWWKMWSPENFASDKLKSEAALEDKLKWVGELNEAGVKLMAGTDFACPFVFPGFSLHDELILLNRAGLSTMQTLQAATLNPAKFLGLADTRGTIEKGKIADLVVLDANPLDDIANTKAIAGVVLRGRYFSKSDLQ